FSGRGAPLAAALQPPQPLTSLSPPPPRLARFCARHLLLGLLAGLMLCLPGCSLFVSDTKDVTIRSNAPDATLFVNGREVGTGTAVVPLKRNKNHVIRAEAPDGRVATARIGRGISTTGVLDIVGGILFLFPFLGALSPGFWDLSQDYLYLDLPPVPGQEQSQTRPQT